MQVKTYGINGLTEWHGDIKAGSISVRVSFTGGTASPSGAQPAYYMTKDPITQFVIENSNEFKSGFIHLEMSHEIPGEHPRMAVPKEAPKEVRDVRESPAADAAGTVASNPDADASGTVAGVKTIKVADKAEAVEWLKSNYPEKGYSSVKLRSKEAFENACKECNVKFEF